MRRKCIFLSIFVYLTKLFQVIAISSSTIYNNTCNEKYQINCSPRYIKWKHWQCAPKISITIFQCPTLSISQSMSNTFLSSINVQHFPLLGKIPSGYLNCPTQSIVQVPNRVYLLLSNRVQHIKTCPTEYTQHCPSKTKPT